MANTKLSDLTALTSADDSDLLYIVDDPTGTAASRKITVAGLFGERAFTGDVELPSDGALYFGDSETNGSYRIRRDDTNTTILWREVRIGGSWVVISAEVLPSGDTTGATDRANIQAAIDALETSTTTDGCGIVVLSGGQYYINDTLYVNSRDNALTHLVVLIDGLGRSRINVTSTMAGTYAIEYFGISGGPTSARINGIYLSCGYYCRGILFHYQAYNTLLQDCYIHRPTEIGIDAIDCYGCQIVRTNVRYCHGMAFRGYRYNSSSITDCKFHGYGCWHTNSETNATLWAYDCLNGRDAAIAEYGDDYNEDWPATDDEYVTNINGDPVQTSAAKRCQLFLRGNQIRLDNVNLESSAYCSYPAILGYLASNVDCNLIRMENTYNGDYMFAIDGSTSYGQNCTFRQVQFRDGDLLGAGNKRSVLEVRGQSIGASVTYSLFRGFRGPIIYAADGDHYHATVSRVITESNEIDEGNWLGAAEGASITSTSDDVNVIQVKATGVAATDTANLQAAIDAACLDWETGVSYDYRMKTVELDSQGSSEGFLISSVLTMNSRETNDTKTPCRIVSRGLARIKYVGDPVDSPILACYGSRSAGRGNPPMLENVFFDCNRKCRGPLIYNQAYVPLGSSVYLYGSDRVGFDLVDCWGSSFENWTAYSCYGIALRTHRFNSGSWKCLRVKNYDTPGNWPATDDETVQDTADDYVQTAEAQRAVIVMQGNDNQCVQTILEGNVGGDLPLMHYRGFCSKFSGIRLEDNSYNESTIVVDGTEAANGQFIVFENVRGKDADAGGAGAKESFLELRGGECRGVVVRDSQFTGFGTAVIRMTSGDHYSCTTENVITASDVVPDMVTEGDATNTIDSVYYAGSFITASDEGFVLGDPDTNGSWRIVLSGDDLVIQRRESGSWVTKSTISAT